MSDPALHPTTRPRPHGPDPARGRRIGLATAFAISAVLAAHLLFIPYAYVPLSFDGALMRFSEIEWLDLGSDQNVALVSRALTWLPIGLLGAAMAAPMPRRRIELPALLTGAVLSALWALLVNFGQLWFPARTFSLNNLVAEVCGGSIGAALWGLGGAGAMRWWKRLLTGGATGVDAALQCYVVVYLIAILTPFDFVTSAADLAEKIDREHLYSWWVAPIGCGPTSCGTKWIAVVLACVPCGWWFATLRPSERHVWLPAALVALVVGAGVEALHFLMVSGVSQGGSVLARALGMALGALSWPGRRWIARFDLSRLARPVVLAALLPYLAALLYLSGWMRSERLAWPAGWQRIDQVAWMPFFQEYYSSYQATMISLVIQALAYGWVGAMAWLWSHDRRRVSGLQAAVIAAALCFGIESSKLWLANRLPDYTDVLIGAGAAFAVASILRTGARQADRSLPGMRSPLLGT
jgi:VanZ family protein